MYFPLPKPSEMSVECNEENVSYFQVLSVFAWYIRKTNSLSFKNLIFSPYIYILHFVKI